MGSKFVFKVKDFDDDWSKLIFYDVETVDRLEDKNKDLSNLDIRNRAKYCAYAYYNPEDKNWYIGGLRGDAKFIATRLLQLAHKLNAKGFCAFNGNKFDFLIFETIGIKLINQRGHLFFWQGKKRFRLVDARLIAKAMGSESLDSWAKSLGIGQKLSSGSLEEYAKHDVWLLVNACLSASKMGCQYTVTRSAKKLFANKVVPEITTKIRGDTDLLRLRGGRTQPFELLCEDVWHYDVNSMYPFVMSRCSLPLLAGGKIVAYNTDEEDVFDYLEYPSFETLSDVYDWITQDREAVFCAEVEFVEIRNELYRRYFPFSFESKDGRRIFAYKDGQTYVLCGPELELAWMIGIIEIKRALRIAPCGRSKLSSLVEELYELRKEAKQRGDIKEKFYKLVMNSLYGIFGLKKQRTEKGNTIHCADLGMLLLDLDILSMEDNEIKFRKGSSLFRARRIHKSVFSVDTIESGFSYLSVPPLAVLITAYSRAYLGALIIAIASMGYKVFYCDTDSLFTNAPPEALESLIGSDLGLLKLEGHYDKALFMLPKTYALWDKEKTKLVSKGTGSSVVKDVVRQKPVFSIYRREFIQPENIPTYAVENNVFSFNDKGLKIKQMPELMKAIEVVLKSW